MAIRKHHQTLLTKQEYIHFVHSLWSRCPQYLLNVARWLNKTTIIFSSSQTFMNKNKSISVILFIYVSNGTTNFLAIATEISRNSVITVYNTDFVNFVQHYFAGTGETPRLHTVMKKGLFQFNWLGWVIILKSVSSYHQTYKSIQLEDVIGNRVQFNKSCPRVLMVPSSLFIFWCLSASWDQQSQC